MTGQVPPQPLFSKFDFTERPTVIVAVSGGSDSLALLFLAKAHLDRASPASLLRAVTVDHGLRPGSAEEADDVGRLCAAYGIAHEIRRWTGPKPETGLPAAAREARYRLLAQAAEEAGTDLILTGHTRDDQTETIAMRRRRGVGPGLAGMAPATLYDGRVWIVRPLLSSTRGELRDFLRGRGIGWVDDPTNQDMAYERARTRAAGVALGAGEAVRAAAERIALAERVAAVVRDHASAAAPGLVRLSRGFGGDDHDAAIHALRILLAVTGGCEQLPDLARTRALFARLNAGALRATLSRVVIDARPAGIFLHRESRELPNPSPLVEGTIWDGRFRISGKGGTLAPLGMEAAEAVVTRASVPQSLARAALSAWPSVSDGAERPVPLALSSDRAERGVIPVVAPWARFLPSFDLAAARAVAALIGAEKIPPPPWPSHFGIEA